MTNLAKQAEAFIRQFGDEKQIAEHFKTSPGFVRKWIKQGVYPWKVIEAMHEAAIQGKTAPPETSEQEEVLPEWVNEDAPAAAEDVGAEAPAAIHAKLNDLHERVQYLEGILQQQGPRIPHSAVRPPNRASNAMQAAGIINSGLPQVGIGTGRAPSRAEAHSSAQGVRGNPAGPARTKPEVKPGDPGWNAGWNTPRPKLQTVQVAWPVNR